MKKTIVSGPCSVSTSAVSIFCPGRPERMTLISARLIRPAITRYRPGYRPSNVVATSENRVGKNHSRSSTVSMPRAEARFLAYFSSKTLRSGVSSVTEFSGGSRVGRGTPGRWTTPANGPCSPV
ncbi:hypothetical protein GCM10025883_24550 [Mobilicoccus caccae]|uniref:Uncharacterized protein n=1 Tax=Mobilicoccus caccae TaxID=1859295 RepID=A0ABQ6ISR5_9MICO|nr:hypothetical protein GCM10025883_24550 [Mobilicoccus caccae]